MNRMRIRIIAPAIVALIVSFGIVATASAQQPQPLLRVASVEVSEVGQTQSTVKFEALVEIENAGETDFDGIVRIDYQVDGGEPSLVYIVNELAVEEVVRFQFKFELPPGQRRLDILIGDTVHTTDIGVTGSDLDLAITEQRVKRGGIVELDYKIENIGDRDADTVNLQGRWENLDDGSAGDVDFGLLSDTLAGGGDSDVGSAQFNVVPGSYRFHLIASTPTVEYGFDNNTKTTDYDVEFVDLKLELASTEVIRWHTEGRGLMKISVAATNLGVDDSGVVTIGIECPDESCSESKLTESIAAGGVGTNEIEVWLPVGENMVTLYIGANEDSFRWGAENVIQATIQVPDPPPLAWSLSAVSDAQEIRYWSDGSANVVFETTMLNTGSELVVGDTTVLIECTKSNEVVENCGGEYKIDLDPSEHPNATRHTIKVPAGTTTLTFSHRDEPPLTTSAKVPERILGVEREIWECFSDTSNLGRETPDDTGIGCAAWRNDYIAKWPVGEPISVWTSGDENYKEIFNQALEAIGPVLNLEFESAATKSESDLIAYLGLPRDETRLDRLRCNHAAGCAQFNIASDGSITDARLVVWPPTVISDKITLDHQIYSIALHELIHVLTGMLHRHHDRTSVMSYDSLDYLTLGEQDKALLRISAHPLVEPGMRFGEIRELIVFADELVDPPVESELSIEEILRRTHARLMDDGSAVFEIRGGWPSCRRNFDWSEYEIGGIRPRAPRWVHFKNDRNHYYMIRTPAPRSSLRYWFEVADEWREVSAVTLPRLTSFRDSFSNPLALLSSINIYGEDLEMKVVSRGGDVLKFEALLDGGDVRTSWSKKTTVNVELEVDTSDFKILSYEMYWSFDPHDLGVCEDYQVEAKNVDYGSEFVFPPTIRREARQQID